jgi:branched-chain amino acid aminotransferase
MSESLVYLNGQLLPASAARLPIYDLAIVQGATVSEMTRTFRQQLFRLDDHIERLFSSLAYVGFDLAVTRQELAAVSHELVEHNAAGAGRGAELALVHFVSAAEHAMYAGHEVRSGPTVCAHTFPLRFSTWAKKFREGVRVITPAIRQLPPECVDPHIKHRSRLHYYLAERQARDADAEAVALLLDTNGHITETNGANFLMVEHGRLVSPRFEKTLAGISRKVVLELAERLALGVVERDLTVADVLVANEAFLTGTPYCMLPIATINGQPIGAGGRGPLFERLISAWSQDVGLDIAAQIG